MIAPDNKLLQKLTRRVREAQASSPSVEAVWLYAETPLPGSLQDLIVEGVSVRSFGPGAVLPPEGPPMKPVRIRRVVQKHVSAFGMVFKERHPDLIVGAVVRFTNARYVVTAVRIDEKTGEAHVTFGADVTTRAQRKGRPLQRTVMSNAEYDRAIAARKEKP